MIFDFKCESCERIDTDVYLKLHHKETDHPVCCVSPMRKYFTQAPMTHFKDYELQGGGFKAGKDGTLITSRRQNREFMKRHDLIDANELGPPPTHAETMASIKESQDSINAITPTEQQATQLKKAGLLDSP